MINIGKHKSLTGFTLLELIIVIIVIGILASIALPQYKKVVEKGRVTEGLVLLSALRSAQFRYFDMTGNYTDDASKLDVEYSTPKYFGVNFIVSRLIAQGIIGLVQRKTIDNPFPDQYFLGIYEGGNITCGYGGSGSGTCSPAAEATCSKIGIKCDSNL